MIQGLRFPPAVVAYFDTQAEIGVATEIIGITEVGLQLFEQIKSGNF